MEEFNPSLSYFDESTTSWSRASKVLKIIGGKKEESKSRNLPAVKRTSGVGVLDCTSHFLGLSKHQLNTSHPSVKDAHFLLIQSVLVRENMLISIRHLIEFLDETYWKYCLERIMKGKRHKNDKEQLKSLRRKILVKQEELAVVVAHLRSASIDVVERLLKYRHACQKESRSTNLVSFFMGDQNYLIKMQEDTEFLSQYFVFKLWLCCSDTFMLPSNENEPRDKSIVLKKMCQDWLQNYSIHMSSALKKNQASLEFTVSTLSESNPDAPKLDHPTSFPRIADTSNHCAFTSWEHLRDYCLKSLEEVDAVEYNSFWNNYMQDPLIIQAATGLPEVFPKNLIIPEIPRDLKRRCLSLKVVLENEQRITDDLTNLADESATLREETLAVVNQEALSTISFGLRKEQSLEDFSMLKFRQETLSGAILSRPSVLFGNSVTIPTELPLNTFMTSTDVDCTFRNLNSIEGISKVYSSTMKSSLRTTSILESNIESKRHMTEKINGTIKIIESMRRCNQGKKPLMEISKAILLIQALIRSFLANRRVLKLIWISKMSIMALKIQRVIRGFLGRVKFRKRKREFQIQITIVRKCLLRKHSAAEKITRLVRRAAYICKKTMQLATSSLVDKRHRHLEFSIRAKQFDKACIYIQKNWRGKMGRRKVYKLLLTKYTLLRKDMTIDRRLQIDLLSLVKSRLYRRMFQSSPDHDKLESNSGFRRPVVGILAVDDEHEMKTICSNNIIDDNPDNNVHKSPVALSKSISLSQHDQDVDVSVDIKKDFNEPSRISNKTEFKRSISVGVLQTSRIRSILIPLSGTKGKLLCADERVFLKSSNPPQSTVSFKDLYRPPAHRNSKSNDSFVDKLFQRRKADVMKQQVELESLKLCLRKSILSSQNGTR